MKKVINAGAREGKKFRTPCADQMDPGRHALVIPVSGWQRAAIGDYRG